MSQLVLAFIAQSSSSHCRIWLNSLDSCSCKLKRKSIGVCNKHLLNAKELGRKPPFFPKNIAEDFLIPLPGFHCELMNGSIQGILPPSPTDNVLKCRMMIPHRLKVEGSFPTGRRRLGQFHQQRAMVRVNAGKMRNICFWKKDFPWGSSPTSIQSLLD